MPIRPLLACALVLIAAAALPAQRRRRPAPSEQANRCAEELPWQKDLGTALATARQRGRCVLWYVPTVAGSPMDRKPVIDLYMRAGPFSTPTLRTFIERRFVLLREVPRGEVQQRYGLVRQRFIEPGLLVLRPDGEEVGRLDRLSVLNTEWLTRQLRRLHGAAGVGGAGNSEVGPGDAAGFAAEGSWQEVLRRSKADAPQDRAHRLRALTGLGRMEEAAAVAATLRGAKGPDAVAVARYHLAAGDPQQARAALKAAGSGRGPWTQEARFLLGVSAWLAADEAGAEKAWRALAAQDDAGMWASRAAAEAERFGPITRGFLRFRALPEAAFAAATKGTQRPRPEAELPELTRANLRYLLSRQRSSGAWDDSNYDFGGQDSLPNVHVAVTALAALALHEWREVDPKACDAAVARALAYLSDDRHLALEDRDELVWAQAYRIRTFAAVARSQPHGSKALRRSLQRVVGALTEMQGSRGSWRHEYHNPFVTATAMHTLALAREGGARIDPNSLERGAELLKRARGEDGTFTYGAPRRRGGSRVEGSAGRMPICEAALLLAGHSDQAKLAHALAMADEHFGRLEAVRKYDDHADRYGNGGFFFWYDQLSRSEALARLEDAGQRERLRQRHLAQLLEIPEIDGTFIDSHELGCSYGAAMGLLTLRRLLDQAPE